MNNCLSGFRVPLGRAACAAMLFCLVAPQGTKSELSDVTMIGPGLRLRPAYDGSASRQAELVPVVRYLGQPWFVRSTQGVLVGGARVEVAPGLHAGARLAYEPGRKTSESGFLRSHAVSDIDPGVFAQATWADGKSAGSFCGITPQQSIATRLPAYSAGSGLLLTSLGLLWSFDLPAKWILVGNVESRRLHGNAERSPLVERKFNYSASAGSAYRF
jgi:outer membrane scaffolding protein for murein synthesis (MipA/OmpV family)